MGIDRDNFFGAELGGFFASRPPDESREAVFDADLVRQGQNLAFPLLDGDVDDVDGDGIATRTVVSAGGHDGVTYVFDNRETTSFVIKAEPGAGAGVEIRDDGMIARLPIHGAKTRKTATGTEVNVGGAVNRHFIFIPEFAEIHGVGRNPGAGAGGNGKVRRDNATAASGIVDGGLVSRGGFEIGAVGDEFGVNFVGARGDDVEFTDIKAEGGGNQDAGNQNRGCIQREEDGQASFFEHGGRHFRSLFYDGGNQVQNHFEVGKVFFGLSLRQGGTHEKLCHATTVWSFQLGDGGQAGLFKNGRELRGIKRLPEAGFRRGEGAESFELGTSERMSGVGGVEFSADDDTDARIVEMFGEEGGEIFQIDLFPGDFVELFGDVREVNRIDSHQRANGARKFGNGGHKGQNYQNHDKIQDNNGGRGGLAAEKSGEDDVENGHVKGGAADD